VFAKAKETFGSIDILVHSIGFAPSEDWAAASVMSARGFKLALDISAYSLIPMAKHARRLCPTAAA